MDRAKRFLDLFGDYTERTIPKHQIIFFQGERVVETYVLLSGNIKIYDITADGSEKLFMILEPGDICPLLRTLDDTVMEYFCAAFNEVRVAVIDTEAFKAAVTGSVKASNIFNDYALEKIDHLMGRVSTIESSDSKKRVAQTMKHVAFIHGQNLVGIRQGYKVSLGLTQQDIANLTGITRETTSIQLNKLQKDGAIKYDNGSILVFVDKINAILDEA
jgi:CRP/FNR family transcriptional regulator